MAMTMFDSRAEQEQRRQTWIGYAKVLALVTVAYNLVESVVSMFFGAEDETIALFGFGLDSLVEVMSGMGILHMLFRENYGSESEAGRDKFERSALKITGYAFYVLAIGMGISAIAMAITNHMPETTLVGVIVSALSIATMWLLMTLKLKAGSIIGSQALIADAHCTRMCMYLSYTLLASSLLFELLHTGIFEIAGVLIIGYFSWKEGTSALAKARGSQSCCC